MIDKKVIFLHMPKCAGSSMKTVLRSVYGNSYKEDYCSYCKFPRAERFKMISSDSFQCDEKEDSGMIFGHFYPFRYFHFSEAKPKLNRVFVTFLRDPLERLASHYAYWKMPRREINHFLLRQMIQEEWSFLDFAFADEMKNFYSQYLFQFPVNAFDFIGIHENLENEWSELCQFLDISHRALPKIRKSDSASILSNLSETVRSEIRDFHSEDYFIYDYAVARSSKRGRYG